MSDSSGLGSFAADPWVRIALSGPRWTPEQVSTAHMLRPSSLHLGEVAELMGCSVFEVQAELGIGPSRDVKWYREIRGL